MDLRPSAQRQQVNDEAEAFAREQSRKSEAAAKLAAALPTAVQTVEVTPDENGMRVDRFMEARFPGLSFSHIQRIVRKGELRVDGKRVETKDRLEQGQAVRIPPLRIDEPKPSVRQPKADEDTRAFLKSITLYEDADMMVLDKPMGLAVQGGSGTTRHVDKMLEALRRARRPEAAPRAPARQGHLRLSRHRQDALLPPRRSPRRFRSRDTRKVYWALVAGVPRVQQGRISTYLAKDEDEKGDARMKVAKHGDDGASHAVTYYAVVETAAQKLAWLSHEAGDRPHPPAARPCGAYRPSHRRRPEILRHRELGGAGRHPAASCIFWRAASCVPHPRTAKADRRHRAAAAAHAADLEPARLRRQALRSHRGRSVRVSVHAQRTVSESFERFP